MLFCSAMAGAKQGAASLDASAQWIGETRFTAVILSFMAFFFS
jgi:hypothetical protein